MTEPFYRRPPTVPAPEAVGSFRAAARAGRAGENGQMTEMDWSSLDTPVGRVSVGCSAAGVAQVRFGPPAGGGRAARDRVPARHPVSSSLPARARRQLGEYFSGERRDFDLPLDWSATSGTQRHVLEVLAAWVGYGQTTSYGALASRAGLVADGDVVPARAVGKIMGSNPIPVIVPCHRVLASDGLGGYSGGAGPEVKRWLLILEGSLPPTLDWEPAAPLPETTV
jgi:methylated-DNA-[protein]-cysteine S-methyltransferase